MGCETYLSSLESVSDWLVWPTLCSPFFYLYIITFLWIFLTYGLYKIEKTINVYTADFISSLAASSLAVSFLSAIGTLVKNSNNIPMISSDILLYVIAITIPILVIWFIKD